jgi:hypothetical protein
MKRKFYLLLISLLLAGGISAQITIGSGIEPVKGAILDLKSKAPEDDNVTSTTGGLLLPRVALEDWNSVALFFGGIDQNADVKKQLTGLIVYNLATTGGFSAGPYSWDGAKWVAVAGAGTGGATYTVSDPITLNGNEIGLKDGTVNGQILKWNGSDWELATDADTNTTYSANNGLKMDLNIVELGGALVRDTDIKTASYTLTLSGASGKVSVATPLAITSGSPDQGKVLTSDASGNASWRTPKSADINGNIVSAGSSAIVVAKTRPASSSDYIEVTVSGHFIRRIVTGGGSASGITDRPMYELGAPVIRLYRDDYLVIHAIENTTVTGDVAVAPY